MGGERTGLERLRLEVDRIDGQIVELLAARMQVVADIAATKRAADDKGPVIRPAREAQLLRRLVEQARGKLPAVTIVRMWRELLAASVQSQAPLAVATFVGVADLAREHFGAATPIEVEPSPAAALAALRSGRVQLAVVPEPDSDEPWWCPLARDPAGVHLLARLPFAANGPSRPAWVLGHLATEPSGDDLTVLALVTRADGSWRSAVPILASMEDEPGELVQLVTVDGFLAADDPALPAMGPGVLRMSRIGSYARPLSAALLG